MVMNSKRFRGILGGVVKESVESNSPAIREIVGSVTSRIAQLKASEQETVDPAEEISSLIGAVVTAVVTKVMPVQDEPVVQEVKAG
jgi:hypothetical protein